MSKKIGDSICYRNYTPKKAITIDFFLWLSKHIIINIHRHSWKKISIFNDKVNDYWMFVKVGVISEKLKHFRGGIKKLTFVYQPGTLWIFNYSKSEFHASQGWKINTRNAVYYNTDCICARLYLCMCVCTDTDYGVHNTFRNQEDVMFRARKSIEFPSERDFPTLLWQSNRRNSLSAVLKNANTKKNKRKYPLET